MAEIELDTVGGEATRETTSIGEEQVVSGGSSTVRVVARSEEVDSGEERQDKPPPYLEPPGAEEEGGNPSNVQSSSFAFPKMDVNKSFIKWVLIAVGVVAAVVVLLVVILVPISFADINYYEVSGPSSLLAFNTRPVVLSHRAWRVCACVTTAASRPGGPPRRLRPLAHAESCPSRDWRSADLPYADTSYWPL